MTEKDCTRCGTCGRSQSAVPGLLQQYSASAGVSWNSGSGGDGDSSDNSSGAVSIARLLGKSSTASAAAAAVVAAGASSDRPKNSDVPAASMRARSLCRFFYRARSRSQRRRLLLWTAGLCVLLTVFYYNHQGLDILSQASSNSRDYDLNSYSFFQAAPMANMGLNKAVVGGVGGGGEEMVGRHPRALLKQAGEAPVHGVGNPARGVPDVGKEKRVQGGFNNDVILKNAQEEEEGKNKKEEDGGEEEKEEEDDKSDLRSDLAPATLHFVWCGGNRHFEFRHFMAVRRAERLVRPDKIFLHYDELPTVDREEYFLWFNRTLVDVPNILLRPLSAMNVSHSCAVEGSARYLLVLEILHRFGGIYIPEDALLVDFPVHLRSSDLVIGVRAVSPGVFRDGLLAGRKGSFKAPSTAEELLVSLAREDQVGITPCGSVEHYNNEEDGECICIKVTSPLYPKDILENHSPFGTLARLSAYDMQEWEPQRSQGGKLVIPRIAHYVCIDCEVRFILFLSMRSSVNVAGLNKVYLHGVKEPRGKWWDKLKGDSRFVYVHREYPETPYDLSQDQAIAMMRISILLKYGGVYCDEKVLWTQRIPDAYFGYSAVASPDWHLYGSWPDSVNHATLMARKNAPYLLRLRSVLHKNQRDYSFWFIDHFKAYKIYETHPDSLFLDRHLQVKCLNHNCHPTWADNYKSGLLQNRPGPKFRWQNETLSVHWTDTFPELDLDTVKYTSGMVVEVCRHILHQSGMVIQDLR